MMSYSQTIFLCILGPNNDEIIFENKNDILNINLSCKNNTKANIIQPMFVQKLQSILYEFEL